MRLTVLATMRTRPLGVHATWGQARRTHAGLVDHDISTAAPLHAADVLAMLAAAPTLHVHGYVALPVVTQCRAVDGGHTHIHTHMSWGGWGRSSHGLMWRRCDGRGTILASARR